MRNTKKTKIIIALMAATLTVTGASLATYLSGAITTPIIVNAATISLDEFELDFVSGTDTDNFLPGDIVKLKNKTVEKGIKNTGTVPSVVEFKLDVAQASVNMTSADYAQLDPSIKADYTLTDDDVVIMSPDRLREVVKLSMATTESNTEMVWVGDEEDLSLYYIRIEPGQTVQLNEISLEILGELGEPKTATLDGETVSIERPWEQSTSFKTSAIVQGTQASKGAVEAYFGTDAVRKIELRATGEAMQEKWWANGTNVVVPTNPPVDPTTPPVDPTTPPVDPTTPPVDPTTPPVDPTTPPVDPTTPPVDPTTPPVEPTTPPTEEITSLEFSIDALKMVVGESASTIVNMFADKEEKGPATMELGYNSSNNEVASIDSKGVITAHAAGVTEITATSLNIVGKVAMTVTVTDANPEETDELTEGEVAELENMLKALPETLTLAEGDTEKLFDDAAGENTRSFGLFGRLFSKLRYKSSNHKVIYVDPWGSLTGCYPGSGWITVSFVNPYTGREISTTINITVGRR